MLFADKVVGNWGGMVNLGIGGNVAGEKEAWFEYGVGISYSFIRGVRLGDIAPSRPEQKWVLQPSVEFIGERVLQGDEAGENSTLLPVRARRSSAPKHPSFCRARHLSRWHAARKHGMTFPALMDGKGDVGHRFSALELPTTVIFDSAGKMRRRFVGLRSGAVVEAMLAEADQTEPSTEHRPKKD